MARDTEDNLCHTYGVAHEHVLTLRTVLALGGASWARLGSDGGWVAPLRAAGVEAAVVGAAAAGVPQPAPVHHRS